MASDQMLALMRLADAINKPSATYQRAVRRAADTLSDSTENLAAIARGETALLELEAAFRAWDAKYSAMTGLPAGFKRAACITVACAVCGYGYDETEYTHHFPSAGAARDGVVGSGWVELKDGRVLCEAVDEKHQELRDAVGVIDPDEEQPAACGKCRQPFDPTDTRLDGHPQHADTPWCRRCVNCCHDNESADHRCVICA